MNIVFFGSSEFSISSLKALIGSRHKIAAVVTQPDRKKGRRLKLSPPPTKPFAAANGIPVYQPADASGKESAAYLKGLAPDLFVVISFGQILRKELLAIPRLYPINVHASLLPKYRGAAPTNWAMINGDDVTGITIIRMNEKMDEGDILLSRYMNIDRDDTNLTLSEKLSELGAKVLLEAIDLIESGKANFTKQDNMKATYAPKLKKEDSLIDWEEDAVRIHNKVRGFIPWPGAHTGLDGKILKIWRTEIGEAGSFGKARTGEVLAIDAGKGIVVKAGSGSVIITHLQTEGKKILDSDSFLRGRKIPVGYRFGS